METPEKPAIPGVSGPTSGRLAGIPLAELLRTIYRERLSGTLDLQQASDQRRVAFVDGEVRSAFSNEITQKLGQHLCAAGRILPADVERALRERTTGERLGQALVSSGAIDEGTLELELRKLVASIVFDAFAWPDGRWRFTPSDAPVAADVMLEISTADVILEGIRRIPSDESVAVGIGDEQVPLRLTADPFLRLQRVTLTPEEGYLVSRLDGQTSTAQLVRMAPMPAAKAKKLVYGLMATGILEAAPRRVPAPRPAAAAPAKPGSPAAPMLPAPPRGGNPLPLNVRIAAERRSTAMLSVPKTDDPELRTRDIEYRRRKIQTVFAQLPSLTANELLELAPNPTYREIRQQFNDLAEIYHPDLAFKPEYADLKKPMTEIFRRLELAYHRLADRAGAQTVDDD